MNAFTQKWFKSLFSALVLLSVASISYAAETVHLNKANAAAFQQNLIGIGPVKAEAIVKYRNKNGAFKNIDDLINVEGIGPALIKKNKRYLSLSKGVSKGDDKAYAAAKKQASSSSSTKKKKSTSSKSKNTAKKETKSKPTSAKSTTKKSSKNTSKTAKPAKSSTKKPAKKASSSKKTDKKPAKKKPTKKKSATQS